MNMRWGFLMNDEVHGVKCGWSNIDLMDQRQIPTYRFICMMILNTVSLLMVLFCMIDFGRWFLLVVPIYFLLMCNLLLCLVLWRCKCQHLKLISVITKHREGKGKETQLEVKYDISQSVHLRKYTNTASGPRTIMDWNMIYPNQYIYGRIQIQLLA